MSIRSGSSNTDSSRWALRGTGPAQQLLGRRSCEALGVGTQSLELVALLEQSPESAAQEPHRRRVAPLDQHRDRGEQVTFVELAVLRRRLDHSADHAGLRRGALQLEEEIGLAS